MVLLEFCASPIFGFGLAVAVSVLIMAIFGGKAFVSFLDQQRINVQARFDEADRLLESAQALLKEARISQMRQDSQKAEILYLANDEANALLGETEKRCAGVENAKEMLFQQQLGVLDEQWYAEISQWLLNQAFERVKRILAAKDYSSLDFFEKRLRGTLKDVAQF